MEDREPSFRVKAVHTDLQLHTSECARLRMLWRKHKVHDYRKPVAEHNLSVVDAILHRLHSNPSQGLIIDACCGKAESTLHVARLHPHHYVVGLDHSAARLAVAPKLPENADCFRADCADVWRVLSERHITVQEVKLYYPNPYPKSEHLLRRWHAHPLFPQLLRISSNIELRTNMRYYAEEFTLVLQEAGWNSLLQSIEVEEAMTAFERKYSTSGHELFRVVGTSPAKTHEKDALRPKTALNSKNT